MADRRISEEKLICKVEGCNNPARYTRLCLCGKHYQRKTKNPGIDLASSRSIYDPNEFIIDGDVIKICLYDHTAKKCGEAIIDRKDLCLVQGYKWRMIKHKNSDYCATGVDRIPLQLIILDTDKKVDHIDRNGLNNRRSNLRKCTHQQNSFNQGPSKNNTSGFKGVTWDKRKKKWCSQIQKNGKHYFLGRFISIEDAVIAHDEAAKKLHGEFAYLNKAQNPAMA